MATKSGIPHIGFVTLDPEVGHCDCVMYRVVKGKPTHEQPFAVQCKAIITYDAKHEQAPDWSLWGGTKRSIGALWVRAHGRSQSISGKINDIKIKLVRVGSNGFNYLIYEDTYKK